MSRSRVKLSNRGALFWCAVALLGLLMAVELAAKVPIEVSGLGWWRNREMRLSLERLTNSAAASQLDANGIEDGAVILSSALNEAGLQRPQIEIRVTLADGTVTRFPFDPTFANPIPRPIQATAVTFAVRPGARWRIAHVAVEGLNAFSAKEGEAYFRSDATLITVARTNIYSRSVVSRSENALADELRRRGFAQATVQAEVAHVNEENGEVSLRVKVNEGPRWRTQSVRLEAPFVSGVTLPPVGHWTGVIWNPGLEQDIRETVRRAYYHGGYPDVKVAVRIAAEPEHGGQRLGTVTVTVQSGRRVTVGAVRFEGDQRTKESVLRRRVSLQPGESLDPIQLEHARYRISRLGVFEAVDLRYEPADALTRDAVFTVRESPHYETNLLAGYGSYEQLRGGVEYRQSNIFGLAHQSRLTLVQSMKSTRGEYVYSVPELFGETIDGAAKLFGLQRNEIAFQRQEYGATVSLRRGLPSIHGEATVGYTFEALRNRDSSLWTEATDEKQLNVASVNFGLTTDRRDNPLRPRNGYHATVQLELASQLVGGAAEYQRLEWSGAYHTPWGSGRWVHIGFSHGVITTMGAVSDRSLPVNKRFFPGGDNSVRGYRLGEAAPRGVDGRFIGGKSYVLLNLELEQALTSTWSVVAFGDALGNAVTLRDYPFSERLYSVGLGVRYQTLVGPVRLEYGRNIHPRPRDPGGTWQISIGYPF